ncbi:hypothetical protein [Chitinophaga sp. Cy-1792]|uniref:hypothetical protein n=1 Tax=Chitinophaga sp. Cy-1792 TaxID=2608339 RepID=UPI00141E4D32|nr:hypothetical protein [Chitinophaga sp. Cy-1792]NIG55945.1 hypothetical protein [Chitinophaga sp. Cy-1792]
MKKVVMLSAVALMAALAASAQTDVAFSNNTPANALAANSNNSYRHEKRLEREERRELRGPKINYLSKEAFNIDFDNVTNVAWSKYNSMDEVSFEQNGVAKEAYYDSDGQLIGTTQVKSFADIPEKAQRWILKKYPDYSIGTVIFFDDNEYNDTDMLLYGVLFEDEDNYFIEMSKGNETMILRVNETGDVNFFE